MSNRFIILKYIFLVGKKIKKVDKKRGAVLRRQHLNPKNQMKTNSYISLM